MKLLQIKILKKLIALYRQLLERRKRPNPEFLIIHHEAGNNGFDKVNEWHRQRWNFKSERGFYIGYQYYLNKQGVLYHGRNDKERGAHCIGYNHNSVGICCEGNFQKDIFEGNQQRGLELLIEKLRYKYNIPKSKVLGHRQRSQTLCPGQNIVSWLMVNHYGG